MMSGEALKCDDSIESLSEGLEVDNKFIHITTLKKEHLINKENISFIVRMNDD